MSDKDLLIRYRAGEEDAFQELLGRYKDSLYGFLRRFLNRSDMVEDVFQETFMQLFVSRDTFDVSRPLRPWLFTIAANKAKDALRRMQHQESAHLGDMFNNDEHTIEDVLNTFEHDSRMPYDHIVQDETAESVKKVIRKMPAKLREIILVAYFNKFSYAEISKATGGSEAAARAKVFRALRRLRALLCEGGLTCAVKQ